MSCCHARRCVPWSLTTRVSANFCSLAAAPATTTRLNHVRLVARYPLFAAHKTRRVISDERFAPITIDQRPSPLGVHSAGYVGGERHELIAN